MANFALHDGSGVLRELPAEFWPPLPLGSPDPFTWDRSPDSSVWFISGDGLGREHPIFQLVGETVYQTPADAFAEMGAIETALPKALYLYWDGVLIANLDPNLPGVYLPRFDRIARRVNHDLTLNVTATVTPANFTGLATPPPPSGTGGGTAPTTGAGGSYVTTIVYIEGVPLELTVWRPNA